MLKKPFSICSYGSTIQLLSPASVSPQPTTFSRRHAAPFQPPRRLAHVHHADSSRNEPDFSWPCSPTFSPYELFKQERSAPYSKRRFYELVKIYHPDRPCNGHPLCKDLPDSVRMHRYRVIVAAHELLSDPVKRAAYDTHGDGWNSRHELFGIHAKNHFRNSAGRYTDTTRKKPGDEIFRNATWEDWQQYYERRDGQPKQAQTVSHNTFVSFLVLLALFGGIGQAVTVGTFSTYVQDRVREVNNQCGQLLDGRRQSTMDLPRTRDARVENFLKKRDPSGYGLKEEEEETYRRLLGVRRTPDALNDIERSQ